ncbi:MAG: SH3 domain-containing protein [bacterium]|nr:SH3 domain-containing protein [bacterium]
MRKDKWKAIRDIIVRNCKIIFPVLLIAVVAFTVVTALNANKAKEEAEDQQEESSVQSAQAEAGDPVPEDVPLTLNEDEEIAALIDTYYTARGAGDEETMRSLMDDISENDLLYYVELSKYIDHYADLEIYCKQGTAEGSVIAYVYYKMGIVSFEEVPGYEALYVCRKEDGTLYIKNQSNFTQEERQYILAVNSQVDVVEFNNRVNMECNEIISANPALQEYVSLINTQVQIAVGETVAARHASESTPEEGGSTQQGETGQEQTPAADPVADAGPQYATATTTVNVRNSDSVQADKLGKLTGGTRVQVQEVLLNGWTRIVYDGRDGYVNSQYLQMEESASGLSVIGTVKATATVNVRSAPNETAVRLGVLPEGDSLELFADEDGWCKVKYNGQVGYVKADYVTQL